MYQLVQMLNFGLLTRLLDLNLGQFASLLNLAVCKNKRPSTSGKEKKSRDSRHC